MRNSIVFLAVFICLWSGASGEVDLFDQCKARVERILNGTESLGPINNETIEEYGYIHHGPVTGLHPDFPRERLLTITIEGCKVLCSDPVDWYWTSNIPLTLGIVSNWVIPIIALLAVLPYDSLDQKNRTTGRVRSVSPIWELFNWLGSPQTALTAIFFNIYQMRKCVSAAGLSHAGQPGQPYYNAETDQENWTSLKTDAYYVLCCTGQFQTPENKAEFLEMLLYGLFRSLFMRGEATQNGDLHSNNPRSRKAEVWARQLLRAMARQMKTSRRRGVWSTVASILLFFVAYGVSIASAFSSEMGDRTTTHSLAFGILISWFPLLVLFAIVDRNPNSADRTWTLISRWLWNVNAVKAWEADQSLPGDPNWWSQTGEDRVRQQQQLSSFIGQGRNIGYNGLPYAVLSAVTATQDEHGQCLYENLVAQTSTFLEQHERHPPTSWWNLSVIAQMIVLVEVGMAIMMSSTVPTIGVGCRSGLYITYGLLTSITWALHLSLCFRNQGSLAKVAGRLLCFLATLSITFTTFASFSGVLKNCTCRGGSSGYLDFENAPFYKTHFGVTKWWSAAAGVAAIPVASCFFVAVVLIRVLQPLWQDDSECDDQNNHEMQNIIGANMDWLN